MLREMVQCSGFIYKQAAEPGESSQPRSLWGMPLLAAFLQVHAVLGLRQQSCFPELQKTEQHSSGGPGVQLCSGKQLWVKSGKELGNRTYSVAVLDGRG